MQKVKLFLIFLLLGGLAIFAASCDRRGQDWPDASSLESRSGVHYECPHGITFLSNSISCYQDGLKKLNLNYDQMNSLSTAWKKPAEQ